MELNNSVEAGIQKIFYLLPILLVVYFVKDRFNFRGFEKNVRNLEFVIDMKTVLGNILLFLVCFCFAVNADGQAISKSTDSSKKVHDFTVVPKVKGPPPIMHEMSGGFRLNSNGWGVYADIGKVKTKDMRHSDMFHNVRLIQIELDEKKDPKELRITSTSGTGISTYIYGKINNFYTVKLGWGFRRMIAGKPDPGSVSIHWVNCGGFALGLLKPYYINTTGDPNAIKFKDDEANFLYKGNIVGGAGFTKGISEMTFIPGCHFKSALHFDFSANRKNVIGVEAGFNAEYYSTAVQLMANEKATNYFVDLFVAAQFGRRW